MFVCLLLNFCAASVMTPLPPQATGKKVVAMFFAASCCVGHCAHSCRHGQRDVYCAPVSLSVCVSMRHQCAPVSLSVCVYASPMSTVNACHACHLFRFYASLPLFHFLALSTVVSLGPHLDAEWPLLHSHRRHLVPQPQNGVCYVCVTFVFGVTRLSCVVGFCVHT